MTRNQSILNKAPNSKIIMKLLDRIFATHGYPSVTVSNNASVFTNESFKYFCQSQEIKQ